MHVQGRMGLCRFLGNFQEAHSQTCTRTLASFVVQSLARSDQDPATDTRQVPQLYALRRGKTTRAITHSLFGMPTQTLDSSQVFQGMCAFGHVPQNDIFFKVLKNTLPSAKPAPRLH